MSVFLDLPADTLAAVLSHSEWTDVVHTSHTCKKLRRICKHLVAHRIATRVSRVLPGRAASAHVLLPVCSSFLKLLHSTDAAVVGSIPLAILTLTRATDDLCEINNLNLLVPVEFVGAWYQFLLESMQFNWTMNRRIRGGYRDHVRSFAVFSRQDMVVTVSGTATRGLLGTIFAARLTSEMNILTKNHIYTFYPRLTKDKKSIPGWCVSAVQNYFQAHIANASRPLSGQIEVTPTNETLQRRCGVECPRLYRAVDGLRGVAVFNFTDFNEEMHIGLRNRMDRLGVSLKNVYIDGLPPIIIVLLRMLSLLPADIELLILNQLAFATLLAYACISRATRHRVQELLTHRFDHLLHYFAFPTSARPRLCAILGTYNGGFTGSSIWWLSCPQPRWYPTDVNLIVGCGGLRELETLFRELGWIATEVPSRIARVIPRPNVRSLPLYSPNSPWCGLTLHFKTNNHRTITITESVEEVPMRLTMEADHSLQAGILTPSTLILLYPTHFLQAHSVLRGAGVKRRSGRDRDLDKNAVLSRGIQLSTIFQ
uniref:F-box domain-containing protein n=1 Tax=Mycena chlorophos TaxID=658473 RepID=A0ABQ0KVP5_MYCCL|nr:predicted protein [Mycena chlorophos]